MRQYLVGMALLVALPGLSRCSGQSNLDPALAYQAARSQPVTYEVDFGVVVTPPYNAKVLKVWLPLPQSDQGQEVLDSRLTTFPVTVEPRMEKEPVYGNQFAYFEFPGVQGAQYIRHQFRITVWELHWNLDPAKVETVTDWPATFAPYRRSESQAVLVDDRFRKLAQEIIPEHGTPIGEMSALMDWVIRDFRYDHNDASLQASSLHGLEKRHGHCSDYHGFCAAMGRVLGYPTRIAYGINPFPKNSPSHCKLEVFLPPYGWVSFDVSETQNLLAAIQKDEHLDEPARVELSAQAKARLLRGFRDNTWFLQTKGSGYNLAPPATRSVSVVRTIYAEADGVALPEPDPANADQHEFAWMTIHKYVPDRPVTYPFKDYASLRQFDSAMKP
jgi:transglutaminase-like putative cysteine protease